MEASINTNESTGFDIQSESQTIKSEDNKEKEEQIVLEDKEDKNITPVLEHNKEDNKENYKEEDKEGNKEENKEEEIENNKEEQKKDIKEEEKKDNKDIKEEDKENNKEEEKEDNKENIVKEDIIKKDKLEDNKNNDLIENNIINDNIDHKEEDINDNNKENIDINNYTKNEEITEESKKEIEYSNNMLEKIKKYNIKRMPDNYNKENSNFKVLFLGDSGVGKSSLVIRGIKDKFDSIYKPTVGFDLLNYIVKINDKVIKLQIWDTCGQEEFSMCNQSLFKNASMAIMVYSITNKKSYDNIKKWVSRLKNLAKEDTVLFLVGNKCDLINERQVNFSEAKKYGKDKFQCFVETSSKNGHNIDILFNKISIYLYENVLEKESKEKEDDSNIEEYISDDQTSSLLDSRNLGLDKKKNCLKCLKC